MFSAPRGSSKIRLRCAASKGKSCTVMMIGPGRTEESVAFGPFDLGRLSFLLVLHHVEALALDDVIDRKGIMPMRLQSLAGIEDGHPDQRAGRRSHHFLRILVDEDDEAPIGAGNGIARNLLELGVAILPIPTCRANHAAHGLG